MRHNIPSVDKLAKSTVIQVLPDEATQAILLRQGKESAKWMNTVFRTLYTDKRNHKWVDYGPDKTWDKKGRSILHWKPKAKRWGIVGEMLYPAFIGKNAKHRIFSPLLATNLQVLSQRVATVWGNFLNGDKTPRPNGHLPEFGPVAVFHAMTNDISFGEHGFVMKTSHPYEKKKKLVIPSVTSDAERHILRTLIMKASLCKKLWSAIEVKLHDDGKWYAHVPISIEVPTVAAVPNRIVGIDMGVRNTFATAVVNSDIEIPKPKLHSGMKCVHRLERIQARVRGLHSATSRGNKNAKKVLERLKGRRTRIQETMARQSAMEIIKTAEKDGAQAIIVENLKSMRKPRLSKRQNRLITTWGRGKARDFMEYKSAEHGLKFADVFPGGTSRKCPKCGMVDKTARDLDSHTYTCKKCNFTMNDDATASINIAHRGWRRLGLPTSRAKSQSSPRAGGCKGQDSRKAGESFNPLKQTAVRSPATRKRAPAIAKAQGVRSKDPDDNAPLNPINGTTTPCKGIVATSRRRARSELCTPRQTKRQASGTVTQCVSRDARTDSDMSIAGRKRPHAPTTKDRPLENGDSAPTVENVPPSQGS